jgi:hypothetical protein
MQRKIKRIKLGKQIYRRLLKKVLERDGWRWQECRSLENLQVHPKMKRSQLGNDSLDDLVTLCAYATRLSTGSYSIQSQQPACAAGPNRERSENLACNDFQSCQSAVAGQWRWTSLGGRGGMKSTALALGASCGAITT